MKWGGSRLWLTVVPIPSSNSMREWRVGRFGHCLISTCFITGPLQVPAVSGVEDSVKALKMHPWGRIPFLNFSDAAEESRSVPFFWAVLFDLQDTSGGI